ncbi:hypothetical protein [Azospirillum sp. SYSU D00513]|uniref:hypothetical protein n=1 Tax=Azospirillum sp. SYSU D00513 TaxID=2812561 RepID=UPI001A974594|nr:hypothetical protein [Azospirillum sp. SYSU D00513]
MSSSSRYAVLHNAKKKSWSVIDRVSNDNAQAKGNALTGLSRVVAIVWADRLNSEADSRSL